MRNPHPTTLAVNQRDYLTCKGHDDVVRTLRSIPPRQRGRCVQARAHMLWWPHPAPVPFVTTMLNKYAKRRWGF